MKKYPKFLASSVNRAELSMTIKGLMTSFIPLILMLAPMFGWSVSADDFKNLTDGVDGLFKAVEGAIVAGTAAVASYWILWGAIRKVLVGLGFLKSKDE